MGPYGAKKLRKLWRGLQLTSKSFFNHFFIDLGGNIFRFFDFLSISVCTFGDTLYKVSFRSAISGCTLGSNAFGHLCSKIIRPGAYVHIVLLTYGISVSH